MQTHFKSLSIPSGLEIHISILTVSLRVTEEKKKGIKNTAGIKSTHHLEEGDVASCSQLQNGPSRAVAIWLYQ